MDNKSYRVGQLMSGLKRMYPLPKNLTCNIPGGPGGPGYGLCPPTVLSNPGGPGGPGGPDGPVMDCPGRPGGPGKP